MRTKKSQITMFIIIGIVLLFGVALFIFIKEKITNTNISAPEEIILAQTPQEVQPIKLYIEECLYQTTKDAFLIMGRNGGYISLENRNINPTDPTESEGFEPLPNQQVPYWMWMSSRNSCNHNCWIEMDYPMLEFPYEYSIEHNAMQYIVDNLDSCLNGFKEFENQGYNIKLTDSYYSRVIVGDKDVSIKLTYPIEITKGDKKFELKKYNTKLDLKFKEIYDYATTILYQEAIYHNFQSNVYSAINAYQRIDYNAMPPMDQTDFTRVPTTWSFQSVKQRLQILLLDYTNSLGIYNSDYTLPFYLFEEQPFWTEHYYSKFLINFENAPEYYEDYKINIRYQGWPYYFDINPKKGDRIEPYNSLGISLPSMFENILPPAWVYKFNYDISYPVLIEIEDPTAFNGEGYMFRYGMEFNIRNNYVVEWADNETINTTGLIQDTIAVSTETLFCDTKNSGNITITVKDKYTNQPIENTNIKFDSGRDSCYLGATDENGKLNSKFPTGYGILTIQKQDYGTYKQYYLTSVGETDSLTIEIYPIKEVPVEIYQSGVEKGWIKDGEIVSEQLVENDAKENLLEECLLYGYIPHSIINTLINDGLDALDEGYKNEFTADINHYKESRAKWFLTDNLIRTLEDDEQIIINFAYQSDLDTGFFVEPIMINPEDITEVEKITATLDLIPGKYLITANIIKQMNLPYNIPAKTKCKDMICGQTSLFGMDDINCYELPEQNLTSLVVGMYMTEIPEYDEDTDPRDMQFGEELPEDKIKNQKTLKIYIPKVNINDITSVDDLQVMGMFQDFAKDYPNKVGLIWS